MFKVSNFRDLEAYISRFYGGRPVDIKPFSYPVNWGSVGNSTLATTTITIAANADFFVTDLTSLVLESALATFNFIDSASNEQFFSDMIYIPVRSTNDGGAFPIPRFINANATIICKMEHLQGGPLDSLLLMNGVNVRPYG